MSANRVLSVSLRRVNLGRYRNPLNKRCLATPFQRSLSTTSQRSLSTTSQLQEVFKSRYTADCPTDVDFYSFMAEDHAAVADKLAVICGASGRSLTYKQLFKQAKQIGISLQQRGYRQGDMAAIFAPNIPEYILTVLGEFWKSPVVAVKSP